MNHMAQITDYLNEIFYLIRADENASNLTRIDIKENIRKINVEMNQLGAYIKELKNEK